MARRRSIVESLRETEEPQDSTPPAPPAEVPQEAPAPARKRAPRKLAAVPADAPTDAPEGEKAPRPAPRVLTADSTGDAKRVGLYLHPDDFRALGMAKLDDGADANARIRAMIALWRHNDRYRAAVDKLARTALRGPR
jgi:hypothetical protein